MHTVERVTGLSWSARRQHQHATGLTNPDLALKKSRRYRLATFVSLLPLVYLFGARMHGLRAIFVLAPIFGPADRLWDAVAPGGQFTALSLGVLVALFWQAIYCCRVTERGAAIYRQRATDLRAELLFQSLDRGPAPYVLFLRPFASTGAYTTRMHFGKHTVQYDFERELANNCAPLGELVALGQSLEHQGAGRITTPEPSWQASADALMRDATLIVMIPSARPGTRWEVERLLEEGWIAKTVFVDARNTETGPYRQEIEWRELQETFSRHGYHLPPEHPHGQLIAFGRSKEPQLIEPLHFALIPRKTLLQAHALSLGRDPGLGRLLNPPAPVIVDTRPEGLRDAIHIHFGWTLTHLLAHLWAAVPLRLTVIALMIGAAAQAGSLAGYAQMRRGPVAGALLVAAATSVALVFGLLVHFWWSGPEHVDSVKGKPEVTYGLTAVLLIAIQILVIVLALKAAWKSRTA